MLPKMIEAIGESEGREAQYRMFPRPLVEPIIKPVSTYGCEEEEYIPVDKMPCHSSGSLRKNFIDNRIKQLQYEANAPCEDSIVCDQLKSLDAYTVSIFDGHGGP